MSETPLIVTIVAVALIVYATRVGGFWLGDRSLPPVVERFLSYVPIAAFAALVAPGVADGPGGLSARLITTGAAIVVVLRLGRLWACMAVGMAVFWLVEGII